MSKIIEVNDGIVSIGMEDKTIKEVREADCNFVPVVGAEVEVFETETKTIVHELKKEIKEEHKNDGINISINNTATNQAPNVQYVKPGKVVNKVVYLVLTFFLGGIGVHKFYTGKIGLGIAYLVFCWTYIPAFIAFVEFIIGCCKKADANGNIIV